ncbi:alginate O-acetyltransferase AlgF [Deinococcus depolymerans]|uniref:Alginate biosynthesis protein AlgF n=1 Tax=Deinococcus depolymerans TaxID=392408 RepID=A0ABN1BPY9_9DEIO
MKTALPETALTAALLLLCAAHAQEALYAPAPPAGSAFVRVVTVDGGRTVTLDGRPFLSAAKSRTVSPYQIVPQGPHTLRAGSTTLNLNVQGGAYHTLVLRGGKLSALGAEQPGGVTRARLTLYNLSDAPASLMTADGHTRLLPDVPAGAMKSMNVNAVSAALGVFAGSAPLQTFPTEALRAGASYSAFVFGTGPARTTVFITPGRKD